MEVLMQPIRRSARNGRGQRQRASKRATTPRWRQLRMRYPPWRQLAPTGRCVQQMGKLRRREMLNRRRLSNPLVRLTQKCQDGREAAAPGRAPFPGRLSALKKAIRGFADKPGDIVIVPAFGMSFDTLGEAYDFDNLYSWEKGFGIRYGKGRLNVERTKCMQEIVCGCAGKARVVNTKSCWCKCPALIKLEYKEQLFFQVEMQLLGFRTMMQVQQTRLGTCSMDCWHKRRGRRWGVQQLAERRRHTRGSANRQGSA